MDQAAYFNLHARPAAAGAGAAIRVAGGVVGVAIEETLYRFDVVTHRPDAAAPLRASNRVGERVGRISDRWLAVPDEFVALPDRAPPPTLLDPTRPQRFVMLAGACTFGGGPDEFRGFGTGRTIPSRLNGHPVLLVTAVGTVLAGRGRFAGLDRGVYVYCGVLAPDRGFTGSLMLRIMDPQGALAAARPLPALRPEAAPEPGVTYVVLRGEATVSDAVTPFLGSGGKQIGLVVQQGLKLHHIDSAADVDGIRAADRVGQSVGRITAYVTFDPTRASGGPLDPVPFTAYDDFVFFDGRGEPVGGFTADSSEGRVFTDAAAGRSAIRFGGVGRIRVGSGPFRDIEGLMTDNSMVVFSPHASASVYVLRINDPHGRFRAQLAAPGGPGTRSAR